MPRRDRPVQAPGLDKAFDDTGIEKNIPQAGAGGLAAAGKVEGDTANRVSQKLPEKSEPASLPPPAPCTHTRGG